MRRINLSITSRQKKISLGFVLVGAIVAAAVVAAFKNPFQSSQEPTIIVSTQDIGSLRFASYGIQLKPDSFAPKIDKARAIDITIRDAAPDGHPAFRATLEKLPTKATVARFTGESYRGHEEGLRVWVVVLDDYPSTPPMGPIGAKFEYDPSLQVILDADTGEVIFGVEHAGRIID